MNDPGEMAARIAQVTAQRDLEDRVRALEAAVTLLVQPEPDFMDRVQADPLHDTNHLKIRLTHLPTGVIVVARDRPEAIHKLRKALADRARRQYDLQEQQRRQDRKAAQETPGAA